MLAVALERREPIARELYAALRLQVMAGTLAPGTPLSEAPLAEQLGVSRTPVREVFRRMADEGLLEIRPQVGTFVAPIRLDAVYDSQFVRETLECRTVRMAAEQITDADESILRGIMTRQRPAADSADAAGFFAADEAFHVELIRIAGRPAIWRVIQDVKTQLDRVRYLSTESRDWRQILVAEHDSIMLRVLDRDPDGAEAVMRQHLRTVFTTIERLSQAKPDFFDRSR
jgi:DNA-binding GntR family transcriptional regulator